MIAALILPLAQAAMAQGPSAATVAGLLEPFDGGCVYGSDRRTGREFDACLVLTPHVTNIDCREAADLGGYVCDSSIRYADDRYRLRVERYELRSDLFARDSANPAAWRFVREITPPRTPNR
jgi:hypothetical protein